MLNLHAPFLVHDKNSFGYIAKDFGPVNGSF